MIYLTTLDSHEYFGPFANADEAKDFATRYRYTSYWLTQSLPAYAMSQLNNRALGQLSRR